MKNSFLRLVIALLLGTGCYKKEYATATDDISFNVNEVLTINYYKISMSCIFEYDGSIVNQLIYQLQNEKFLNKCHIYFENDLNFSYSWGYRYKVSGYFDEHVMDDTVFVLDEIISIEKHFEPFTLTFRTHTIIDGVFNFQEEPLITKTSNDKYLAYNELEFKVYDQDLQENLDLRIDNNYTVTLTFDFEDNGTIFLKQIEE